MKSIKTDCLSPKRREISPVFSKTKDKNGKTKARKRRESECFEITEGEKFSRINFRIPCFI